MTDRFSLFTGELANGGVVIAPLTVELITPDGELLASTRESRRGTAPLWEVELSALSLGQSQVSQRTASLTVVTDSLALVPYPGGPLHPDTSNRVRIYSGIVAADGTEHLWALATMLVQEVEAEVENDVVTLNLQLVDLLTPLDSEMEHSFEIRSSDTVATVVARILGEVYREGSYLVSECGYTIGRGLLPPGTNRMQTVMEMLEGCGQEITTTALGLVVTREVLPSDEDPNLGVWVYGGAEGVPYGKLNRIWPSRAAQAWKIEGGSFTSSTAAPSVMVFDLDPRSEGFWRPSASHRHIETTRLPWVEGVNQAAVAGYAKLRQHGRGPGEVTFTTVTNPALQEGDQIYLHADSARSTGLYRVRGWVIHPDGSDEMSVTARGVFNPALSYEFPLDRSEGCIVSISDTFDRDDGPLANPFGEPGKNWVTTGPGWAIFQQNAVQQSDGIWSMALINTPMCSLDVAVTVKPNGITLGMPIGIVARSSGEGDGYVALIDKDGSVSLEIWQNNTRADTLARSTEGATLSERDVTLKAVGDQLSVLIGSEVVLTATDQRRNGSHVGLLMVGGGPGTNYTNVDQFTVVEV